MLAMGFFSFKARVSATTAVEMGVVRQTMEHYVIHLTYGG
jgi:hypothetical protein